MTPNPTPSAPRTDVPLVDCHAHIFKLDMPLLDQPRHRPTYSYTVEDYLRTLDEHGISMGVLAAASPWGDCNDYMVESVRAHPRLRGTVILDPNVERIVLDDMARAGIVGIRLPFIGRQEVPDLDSFAWRKHLWRLRELDWHVHLHSEGDRLPQFLPALERSGIKIVIDHIGRPDARSTASEGFAAMARSVQRGRTWVKLSGAYRLGPQAASEARELVRQVGHDRMVWASDCPFVGEESKVTYRQTMDWLKEAVPDAAAREQIGGRNALELYFA